MEFKLPKRALSLAVVGASVIGASALATGSASAADWKCVTSKRTIDDASYTLPAPDDVDIKVTNCVKRSGSYVYAKAKVTYDWPPSYAGGDFSNTFDSAHFRLNVNHVDAGPDTVYLKKDYNLVDDFNRINGSGNGSASTATFKVRVGSKSAYTDGTLRFNWQNDGKGVRSYGFTGTPSR